jgi:hypothetical protein
MEKSFSEVLKLIDEFNNSMSKHDKMPWQLEQKILDLQNQIGGIAKAALEKGDYKTSKNNLAKVNESLAMSFILLVDIANTFGINFQEALSKLINKEDQ